MEEQKREKVIDIYRLWAFVWSRKKQLFRWGLLGLAVGLVVSFSIPKEYTCTVKVAPESKPTEGALSSLSGLASMMGVSGMGGGNDAGIGEALYPEVIKSSPFLGEFAYIKVPYGKEEITLTQYLVDEQKQAWWSYAIQGPMKLVGWLVGVVQGNPEPSVDKEETDDVKNPSIERRIFEMVLSGRISLEQDKKSRLLTIQVKMQDPKVAMLVADSLLTALQCYMVEYHTAKARTDLELNQVMFEQAREKFYRADSLYASMIDRNQNLISKAALIKLERYKNERDLTYSVYQQLASQLELNRLKLQEETPIATVIEPTRVPDTHSSPKRLFISVAFLFLGLFFGAARLAVGYIRNA